MSHEGIQFVSTSQAQQEARSTKLSGLAISPQKVRVDKTGGTGMVIEWRDGATSEWNFAWLRAACPCATCHEAREAEGREPGEAKPQPATLLPMYVAPVRPVNVTPVGKYALRFDWNDGHTAGIYSWDYLRNVCDGAAKKQASSSKG